MQYPLMNASRSYRVSVPELNGGINRAVSETRIEDNQLADCKNVWWKDTTLCTRPGLRNTLGTGSGSQQTRTIMGDDIQVKINDGNNFTIKNAKVVLTRTKSDDTSETESISLSLKFYDGTSVNVDYLYPPTLSSSDTCFLVTDGMGRFDAEYVYEYPGQLLFISDGRIYTPPTGIYNHSEPWMEISSSAYVPLVMVNGVPSPNAFEASSGTMFEGYNLLTGEFRADFTSDGKGKFYHLPEKGLTSNVGETIVVEYTHTDGRGFTWSIPYDATYSKQVTLDGESVRALVNRKAGWIQFEYGQDLIYTLPESAIRNNVSISAWKTSDASKGLIAGMQKSIWFGGDRSGTAGGTRLFVTGNPNYPNLVHWSDLNNPLYFPENNYAYIGESAYPITGFGKQDDMLVIFKENEIYCATYVAGNTITAQDVIQGNIVDVTAYAATFPITQVSAEFGCDCPETIQLCNNRLIWANSTGNVYTLASASAYNQRNVRCLSDRVFPLLSMKSKEELKSAKSGKYCGYYLLLTGNDLFLFGYNAYGYMFINSYTDNSSLEKNLRWFVWDVSVPGIEWTGIMARERDGLLIGESADYVFDQSTSSDDYPDADNSFIDHPIPYLFRTKQYDFDKRESLKNIVSAYLETNNSGSMRISYKTEKGMQEGIQFYPTGDICRIKPNCNRVSTFGIEISGNGKIEISGITLNYKLMGGVR